MKASKGTQWANERAPRPEKLAEVVEIQGAVIEARGVAIRGRISAS